MNLANQLKKILDLSLCDKEKTYYRFLQRIDKGKLTRSENKESHFCVYFMPYNPEPRKIFIVHHKKASLWLSQRGRCGHHNDPECGLPRSENVGW